MKISKLLLRALVSLLSNVFWELTAIHFGNGVQTMKSSLKKHTLTPFPYSVLTANTIYNIPDFDISVIRMFLTQRWI